MSKRFAKRPHAEVTEEKSHGVCNFLGKQRKSACNIGPETVYTIDYGIEASDLKRGGDAYCFLP